MRRRSLIAVFIAFTVATAMPVVQVYGTDALERVCFTTDGNPSDSCMVGGFIWSSAVLISDPGMWVAQASFPCSDCNLTQQYIRRARLGNWSGVLHTLPSSMCF